MIQDTRDVGRGTLDVGYEKGNRRTTNDERPTTKQLSIEDKLFLVKTKKDTVTHIKVNNKKCAVCKHKICLIICPAQTYEEVKGKIEAAYENCLECGSCRVACVEGAISWSNPRGNFGVVFKNG